MDQMWRSLSALRALPDGTRVYCAHEYTQANARFALSVDGDNAALVARAAEIDSLRAAGRPTVPSRLGEENAPTRFYEPMIRPWRRRSVWPPPIRWRYSPKCAV